MAAAPRVIKSKISVYPAYLNTCVPAFLNHGMLTITRARYTYEFFATTLPSAWKNLITTRIRISDFDQL